VVREYLEDPVSPLDNMPDRATTLTSRCSLALNYKKIAYTTVWVEYADIQTVSKEIGATTTEKRPTGEPRYTLPAIRNPATGEVVADSAKIIAYLEEKYPERPLIPAGALGEQLAFTGTLFGTLGMVGVLRIRTGTSHRSYSPSQAWLGFATGVGYGMMTPRSGAAFERLVRSMDNGPPFAERTPPPPEAWTAVQEGFSRLAQQYGAHKYVFGEHVTYADLLVASVLFSLYPAVSDERKADIRKWDGGRWGALMDEFQAAGYTATDRGEDYVAPA
jgi:glutathione S-transferase